MSNKWLGILGSLALSLGMAGEVLPQEQPKTDTRTEYRIEHKYKTHNPSRDSDDVLLARLIFGEARNCSLEERIAVAYTAINRARDGKKWNGETIKESILKPYQYSCFNKNDPNRKKVLDPESYEPHVFYECLEIARKVLKGEYKDPTNGATHYHTRNIRPRWSRKLERIERPGWRHIFYRE